MYGMWARCQPSQSSALSSETAVERPCPQFAVVECQYALPVLCNHGTPTPTLNDVFQATIVAKNSILFTSLVWLLFSSRYLADWLIFMKTQTFRFCDNNLPSVESLLCSKAYYTFFNRSLHNDHHVLQPCYLSSIKWNTISEIVFTINYLLVITKTAELNDRDFITRTVYKSCY